MDTTQLILIGTAIMLVAFLYSSVGHAGASGYIAVLTLFGFSAGFIKPTTLVLNILVAAIGSYQFWRAGHFSWPFFWPFGALAVPAAFLGGYLHLPTPLFKILLGVVLLCSALRLFLRPGDAPVVTPPARLVALGVGAGIGLLSGLTGTGGGIFLTPLLLFCRVSPSSQVALTSAAKVRNISRKQLPLPSSLWITVSLPQTSATSSPSTVRRKPTSAAVEIPTHCWTITSIATPSRMCSMPARWRRQLSAPHNCFVTRSRPPW